MAEVNAELEEPADAKGHLNKFRPGAIVTAKIANNLDRDLSEPFTAGASATFTRTPGLRLSMQNKSGKEREIAKIEPPGKVGDFYDFGSILGRGGFGTVTEILHAKTFEPFAGKVITKASLNEVNNDAESSFRKVMETFLNHEHMYIVKMLHIFEDESNYYQVMEACQGGTLRKFIRNYESIPGQTLELIVEQVCSGIAFLHGLRLLHRDIKPDNVMLAGSPSVGDEIISGTRRIKLNIVDFDMCTFMNSDDEAFTGHIEGTPGYLAPEVLTTRKYSQMTDLFSFGCLMFFVLKCEEPGTSAGFDSLPTVDLVEQVVLWTEKTIEFCTSIDPEAPQLGDTASGSGLISPAPEASVASGRISPSSPLSTAPTSPLPGQIITDPPTPTSPLSAKSPTSGDSDQLKDSRVGEAPPRLWRLMAWCVQVDPARRPQCAELVLQSGLIRGEPASPGSPDGASPCSPKTKKKKEKKEKRVTHGASISDLLKLT